MREEEGEVGDEKNLLLTPVEREKKRRKEIEDMKIMRPSERINFEDKERISGFSIE